jgi:hypothetical protein
MFHSKEKDEKGQNVNRQVVIKNKNKGKFIKPYLILWTRVFCIFFFQTTSFSHVCIFLWWEICSQGEIYIFIVTHSI